MMTKTMVLMAAIFGGEPAAPAAPAPVASLTANGLAHLAGLSLGAPTRVAAQVGANEIVDKVQEFYRSTKTLTAKFRQTYTNVTFGKESISDGRVWIKKPGKMRWDYQGKKLKVEKSFISDGTTLWAVEHDTKQIFTKSLQGDMLPVAISFLYGKGDLKRDFAAQIDGSGKYGAKTDHVLKLTPRQPTAQYKTLYLVVDPGNFRVKTSIVVESSGNTNQFMFFEPQTNKAFRDTWFVFNVDKHKSYRLIEK